MLKNLESIKGLENNLNFISMEMEDYHEDVVYEREAESVRDLIFDLQCELKYVKNDDERQEIKEQIKDYEHQLEVGDFDMSHYEQERDEVRDEFEDAITETLDYARGYISDHNLIHLDIDEFIESYEDQLRTMYEEQKYHLGSRNHNTSFEHVLSRFTYIDGSI